MRARQNRAITAIAAAVVFLLGCSTAATPTPTAPPRATLAPTAPPVPTATLSPVASPTPQATPQPTPTSKPAASSATPQPKRGGTVRYAILRDPPTWNPFIETVDPLTSIKTLVFTSLFTWWSEPPQNCQRGIYPLAVQEWRWVDDTTVAFTLKKGIKYHNKPPVNGREAVASDIAETFPLSRGVHPRA